MGQTSLMNSLEKKFSSVNYLTNREYEMFKLIGDGLKTKEIAIRMNLTKKTAECYADRIRQTLNLDNHRMLVVFACQYNMSGLERESVDSPAFRFKRYKFKDRSSVNDNLTLISNGR